MFYKLNTLIRLVADQLLGYWFCHLSKSWKSRFVVADPTGYKSPMQQ